MITIKKKAVPVSFAQYSKKKRAHFDDMPTEVKNDLRKSLLEEQGYLCAYCMCRIADSGQDTKIEHYRPRDENNELDYNNLLKVRTSKIDLQVCRA
jgi:uncharacterized protein (TIGR02646 family)